MNSVKIIILLFSVFTIFAVQVLSNRCPHPKFIAEHIYFGSETIRNIESFSNIKNSVILYNDITGNSVDVPKYIIFATNNKTVEYEEVFGQKSVCNFKRSIKIYECVAASNGYSCTKKGSGCGRHSITTGDYISKSDKTFLTLDWRCFWADHVNCIDFFLYILKNLNIFKYQIKRCSTF